MRTGIAWDQLAPILATKGLLTDRGHSRYAHIRACPKCKRHVITGIDWQHEMFKPNREIYADPAPLTAQGETAALLLGRRTYDLAQDPSDGRWRLQGRSRTHRWADSFKANPIGPDQIHDVVPEHVCGSSLPSKDTVQPALKPLPVEAPF